MNYFLHSELNSEKLREKDIMSILTGDGAKLELSIGVS